MTMRYFVYEGTGAYAGAYDEWAEPPAGTVEVFIAPNHGLDVWDFVNSVWIPYVPPPPEPQYPNEAILTDQGTGLPVKIVVVNGQVFVGGINDETPA